MIDTPTRAPDGSVIEPMAEGNIMAPIAAGAPNSATSADLTVSVRVAGFAVEVVFLRHEPQLLYQELLPDGPTGPMSPVQVHSTISFVEAARVRMDPPSAANAALNILAMLMQEGLITTKFLDANLEVLKQQKVEPSFPVRGNRRSEEPSDD